MYKHKFIKEEKYKNYQMFVVIAQMIFKQEDPLRS